MNTTGENPGSASVPRPAATILLLREAEAGVEILMVRRHAGLAFMAGQWVFPGGALHAADQAMQTSFEIDRTAVARMTLCDADGAPLPSGQVAALAIAACRETFEETGIVLATRADGSPPDPALLDQLRQHRNAVCANAALFGQLLQSHALRPNLSGLIYWAHWITPSSGARRFDTRFFVVQAPHSHDGVNSDTDETVESLWMTPRDLLEAARTRAMPISHPTQCNLYDLQLTLSRYASLAAFFAGESTRRVVPILPKMFAADGQTLIVMPWDEEYAAQPGEGIAVRDCGSLADLSSRFLIPKS